MTTPGVESAFFTIKTREKTKTSDGSLIGYRKLKEERRANAIRYFQSTYLYEDGLREGPDGEYTWIIKEPAILIAAKARSAQELGTLHSNLAALSGVPGNVIAAGELKIDRGIGQVKYNLFSGSYMEPIFKNKARVSEKDRALRIASSKFAEVFSPIGLSILFTEETLIIPTQIVSAPANINIYDRFFNSDRPTESRTNGVNMGTTAKSLFSLEGGGNRRTRTRRRYKKSSSRRNRRR